MENRTVYQTTAMPHPWTRQVHVPPRRTGRRRGVCCVAILALWLYLVPGAVAGTVRDQLGRRLELPQRPERIVSLAPSITEILFALDLSDRLVGVTRFSDYPAAARVLPKVGSYVQLDAEKIVALKPDLCIAIKDGNPVAVVDRLSALGIPVYAVDPRDLTSVMDTLLELGRLLDAEDRAAAIVSGMDRRIAAVQRVVAGAAHRPRVFFQIGIAPIVSAGTGTFIHELIEKAGGVNLAAGDIPYPRFSREAVIASAPEVMIITSMARQTVFERVKREWQQWETLPAVRQERIYLVDSNVLDRPTPRLVDGLELLARLIHPDRFQRTDKPDSGASP